LPGCRKTINEEGGKPLKILLCHRGCKQLPALISILTALIILQFIFTIQAFADCRVDSFEGYQPYPSEIAPVFDKASRNQLGSDGPTLPKIWKGDLETGHLVDPTIPNSIIKAIGYFETHAKGGWKQFIAHYGENGPINRAPDCGYGIMQITYGMSDPGPDPGDFGEYSYDPDRVASDYKYNIGTGALFLISSWMSLKTEFIGNNNPAIYEDWYYAVWTYNGHGRNFGIDYFNHPNNPVHRQPFPVYDGGNRSDMPYQEAVWSLIRDPTMGKALYNGKPLWDVIPDLQSPDPSSIPYIPPRQHYIPTPLPCHIDTPSCYTINPGQGAPDKATEEKFTNTYNSEVCVRGHNLGCATTKVDTFSNTFYSPPISGYYQDFDGGYEGCRIEYVPDHSSYAYSVKLGFYITFMSFDSVIDQDVYTLLVSPTDNEKHSSSNSVADTVYTWQPFIKGSMYYFEDSQILDGTELENDFDFDGEITYVWGPISERYKMLDGRKGELGLPLFNEMSYGMHGVLEWKYQWFEKGFIWFIKLPLSGDWTFAYKKTANVYSDGEWIPLGWESH